MEIGKLWGDAFLSTLSNEKKLELVKDIPVHERLKDVPVHERLKDVSIDTIETILSIMKQQGKK